MTENAKEDAGVPGPDQPAEDGSLANKMLGITEGTGPESGDPRAGLVDEEES